MCGIAGFYNFGNGIEGSAENILRSMNNLQKHRGPDGEGVWVSRNNDLGLAHVRLSIIGLTSGAQPMKADSGNVITFNGEIYNYRELKKELEGSFAFHTDSDTEVILAAYEKWGDDCVLHLRGMFAFAIWDEKHQRLFIARDRFGIKPFYYTTVNGVFYFASEIKALVPFLPEVRVNEHALNDYLTFQFSLGEQTLFADVFKLMPGHCMVCFDHRVSSPKKYWEVFYQNDFYHSERYFVEKTRELLEDSVKVHMRSDVPVGAYLSGGIDSSITGALGVKYSDSAFAAFTGKFTCFDGYDESGYARCQADRYGMEYHDLDITSTDFIDSIRKIIYHLDEPVAGPGAFPQYWVSRLVSEHRKVVLGGQGGDEIFGGYTRYLVAYFEQCIKGAIDGTLHNGNFLVSYESIIPNLQSLRNYKPMIRNFWKEGVFEELDSRYYRLVNRAPDLTNEIRWEAFQERGDTKAAFEAIFNAENVGKTAYFDLMTHFDFKTLLPALLQVEDRMSMAHGVESRVPFLDHPLIEFLATVPPEVKFKNGCLKRLLIRTCQDLLAPEILNRKDKMGFPVPLSEWMRGELRDFVGDIFLTQKARNRSYFNSDAILQSIGKDARFSRKLWGLMSLELWFQEFYDNAAEFRKLYTQTR